MGNETPAPDVPRPDSMGLPARFFGILFSPGETFNHVVREPRWLGILVVTSIIAAIFIAGFLNTEVGRKAWLDEALSTAAAASGERNEAHAEALGKFLPYLGILGVLQALLGVPIVSLILSGVLFVVFSVILGATATFRQLFAVVVHSGVVGSVQQLFTWPLNYLRESMSSPSTLAVFLPTLDEDSFVYHFLNAIDLFLIWWLVVLSIGLGALYGKKTKAIATSSLLIYGIIALIIALYKSS